MRLLTLTPILALVLLIALAAPVQAGEWVHGDVCKYRLPSGFKEVDLAVLPDGKQAEQQLQAFQRMFGAQADAEFKIYTRTMAGKEDAMLAVMGIRVKGRAAGNAEMGLDQLEQQMRRATDQMAGVFEDLQIRRASGVRGADALEIVITMFDPRLEAMAISRMVFAVDDKSLAMVVFTGRQTNVATDDMAWTGLLGSLSLGGRHPLVRLAFRYGPYALGLIGLFVVISLLKKSGRDPKITTRWPTPEGGVVPPAASGSGLSRPADGLPTYQDGMPAGGPQRLRTPAVAGASRPGPGAPLGAPASAAPSAASPSASAPGGRTIPRSTLAPVSVGAGGGAPALEGPGRPVQAPPRPNPVLGGAGMQSFGGPPPLGNAGPPPSAYGGGAMPGVVTSRAPGNSSALRRPTPPSPPPVPPLGSQPPPLGALTERHGPPPTNVARRDPSQVPAPAPTPAPTPLGALDAIDLDKPPAGSAPAAPTAPTAPTAPATPSDNEESGLKIQRNSDYT